MPRKMLTTVALDKLKPDEYWDAICPGLILRVGARRRTWTLRHTAGGKKRRDVLGHFPAMGLAQARGAADKLLKRVDAGAPPDPKPLHPRAEAMTLGELIDRYEKLREKEGQRTKTLPAAMRTLRNGLKPYLGLKARDFGKADLRAARDVIADRDALMQANRMLAYLGPVLKWAAQEDLISHNFVGDIRKSPEKKRDRVLTAKEITAIWKACDRMGAGASAKAFGRMVRFLLVAAQRRDEAASLKHGDILDGTWRQQDNKASRPHSLKLPPLALALIGEGKANEFVFAGVSGKISGFSKLKRELDELAQVTDWRLHDLRRTAATGMQELGVPHHTIEAILNHAMPGVAGVYQRSELEAQKAEALSAWATAIERILAEPRHRTRA